MAESARCFCHSLLSAAWNEPHHAYTSFIDFFQKQSKLSWLPTPQIKYWRIKKNKLVAQLNVFVKPYKQRICNRISLKLLCSVGQIVAQSESIQILAQSKSKTVLYIINLPIMPICSFITLLSNRRPSPPEESPFLPYIQQQFYKRLIMCYMHT